MKFALIGNRGCGKSILFDLLRKGMDFHDLPRGGRLTSVNLLDERLIALVQALNPEKYREVELTLVDPGMGFHPSSQNILDSDVLCLILREDNNFEEIIEAIFKRDIEIVIKKVQSLEKELKKHRQEEILVKEYELFQKLQDFLKSEKFLKASFFTQDELKLLASYQLLSLKEMILILNFEKVTASLSLQEKIKVYELPYFLINLNLHYEIVQLQPDERRPYYQEYNLAEDEVENLLKFMYNASNFITFYTIVGDEIRAWPLKKGKTVLEAAGKIHTDMAKGFIRAEVISFKDFCDSDFSLARAKEKGVLRLESKEYLINDGDIVYIRFKV